MFQPSIQHRILLPGVATQSILPDSPARTIAGRGESPYAQHLARFVLADISVADKGPVPGRL